MVLYPRGEAGEEGRSVFGDVSEQAKNSAVLVYEGQYEMKPAINRYRPSYMDRLADWSAGALPPVEAFGPATCLFELHAPCATDQAALLEVRLFRRSGDKVTEFNRVQYAAISRTATSTVERVLWSPLGWTRPIRRQPAEIARLTGQKRAQIPPNQRSGRWRCQQGPSRTPDNSPEPLEIPQVPVAFVDGSARWQVAGSAL